MDRNPRIAIQRLDLLTAWSNFLPFFERSTKEFDPIWRQRETQSPDEVRGPFLESPDNFSGPKSKYREQERGSWLAKYSILFH